jgi:membrane protein
MPSRKIKYFYLKISRFITQDIWRLDSSAYGHGKAWGLSYLKAIIITIRGMSMHKVGLQAAALTFFSLMAIIPFVAVIYAITKGFGFTKELETIIYANFSGQEEIVQWILQFANNMLNTSKSGVFGIIGFFTFFGSIIWVMISVEQAFNTIWQVKKSSPIARKIMVYFGLIAFSPLLISIFLMIPLSYSNFIQSIGYNVKILTSLKPIIGRIVLFLFFCPVIFAAFKLIPHTKVRNKPALRAAIITTIFFILIQVLYVETQLFVSRLNAIYGAFAAIPFFMMWLQMSWLLILLGAELSCAFQTNQT